MNHHFKASIAILFVSSIFSVPARALINASPLTNEPDLVRLNFAENRAVCTGFFVDATTIVTAAHCLYRSDSNTLWNTKELRISNDTDTSVEVRALIPHPEFKVGGRPNDIGIIETSPNKNFKGSFILDLSPARRFGTARLYGAGRIDLTAGTYGRSKGTAPFFRVGSAFYSLGKSRLSSTPGSGVTVAPNDSGGPIIDMQTGKVIAVAVRTTLTDTYGTLLPALVLGRLFLRNQINLLLTNIGV